MRRSAPRCPRSRGSAAEAASGTVVEMGAEPGGLAMGLSPNNAPRPRPKAGFAMRPECRRAGELSIQSTTSPGQLMVAVNGTTATGPATIPGGQTLELRSSLPDGATDVSVRHTGTKTLVLLETAFD